MGNLFQVNVPFISLLKHERPTVFCFQGVYHWPQMALVFQLADTALHSSNNKKTPEIATLMVMRANCPFELFNANFITVAGLSNFLY